MKVLMNGKETIFESKVTVQDLLEQGYVEMQDYVTVQVNDAIISRDTFKTHVIKDGDVIEFLYYMGGGCK